MTEPVTLESLAKSIEEMQHKSGMDKVWDVATKLLVPVVLAIAAWMVTVEVRVSVIESNRFTNKDAEALYRRVKAELPPVWLREALAEIKKGQAALADRIRLLEKEINKK